MVDNKSPVHRNYGLFWGVKESFVAYVQNLHDGKIEVKDGADYLSSEQFYFPLKELKGNELQVLAIFHGSVEFQAHFGLLSLSLKSPRLVIREGSADLAVSNQQGGWDHLAQFTLSIRDDDNTSMTWESVDATLTEAGSKFFGGPYSAGEGMSPMILRLPN